MLGGGNPATIPEAVALFDGVSGQIGENRATGLQTLANYDAPQGKAVFLETLADFFREQYGWKITSKNIALTHGSQSSFLHPVQFLRRKIGFPLGYRKSRSRWCRSTSATAMSAPSPSCC